MRLSRGELAALPVVAAAVYAAWQRRRAAARPPPDAGPVIAGPVIAGPGQGRRQMVAGDVRRWLELMDAAGGGDLAPVFTAAGELSPRGNGFPGGLGPMIALGGYPRAGIGPPVTGK